jgi:hypothetical protein
MTTAEIEALVDRRAQEISDKRVAGLMSTYDRKIAEQAAALRKMQRSFSNDDDDSPDPRVAELEAELATVQREAAEAEAARLYPDVYEDFKALTGRETPADQLAYLRELRTRLAAPPSAEPPAVAAVPPTQPVDPNQPARNEPVFNAGQAAMSDQEAWDVLSQFSVMPGHQRRR